MQDVHWALNYMELIRRKTWKPGLDLKNSQELETSEIERHMDNVSRYREILRFILSNNFMGEEVYVLVSL